MRGSQHQMQSSLSAFRKCAVQMLCDVRYCAIVQDVIEWKLRCIVKSSSRTHMHEHTVMNAVTLPCQWRPATAAACAYEYTFVQPDWRDNRSEPLPLQHLQAPYHGLQDRYTPHGRVSDAPALPELSNLWPSHSKEMQHKHMCQVSTAEVTHCTHSTGLICPLEASTL